jgi:hypothetical protein
MTIVIEHFENVSMLKQNINAIVTYPQFNEHLPPLFLFLLPKSMAHYFLKSLTIYVTKLLPILNVPSIISCYSINIGIG